MGEIEVKSISKGSKIRYLREELGLGRTVFGAKIGYSYQQIERVEDGINAVSDDLCRKISKEYGVSMEWLTGDEGAGELVLEESEERRRKRMRQAYEESGLSQREFARQTHTSASMLGDVIAGRKKLTIFYAKKIEESLGIGADWLMYGDEKAKEYPLSDAMIRYMKEHPEIRKEIFERMETDAALMSKDAEET
ncbi:MAG: helix-turn-helix domain-containing protein [Lachnospiraceae bacterium]|nr:helix-turn-helix domain-containing protein [Lachnospiraceae bacterium]